MGKSSTGSSQSPPSFWRTYFIVPQLSSFSPVLSVRQRTFFTPISYLQKDRQTDRQTDGKRGSSKLRRPTVFLDFCLAESAAIPELALYNSLIMDKHTNRESSQTQRGIALTNMTCHWRNQRSAAYDDNLCLSGHISSIGWYSLLALDIDQVLI